MKIFVGVVLALVIGGACRWFDIPVPSPPKLVGALLVVAMTIGYIGVDILIEKKYVNRGASTTQSLCRGPTGVPASDAAEQHAQEESSTETRKKT